MTSARRAVGQVRAARYAGEGAVGRPKTSSGPPSSPARLSLSPRSMRDSLLQHDHGLGSGRLAATPELVGDALRMSHIANAQAKKHVGIARCGEAVLDLLGDPRPTGSFRAFD